MYKRFVCVANATCREHKDIGSYKYIPFTHYQSLCNSYIVYTIVIRANRNLFSASVSPQQKYSNKVHRYSAGQQQIISDQIWF